MKAGFVICLLLLMGCKRSPRDPIDALMEELPNARLHYNFVPLPLPATASLESLIREMATTGRLKHFGISTFTNRETRSVHTKLRERDLQDLRKHGALNEWQPEYFTAVLLDTDAGRKVLLLRHLGKNRGWYYRIHDSK